MEREHIDEEYKPLILIVEDIPKNVQVLCNILQKDKYRIGIAGNGKQALDMVPDIKPDLILLDVMMPVMNGFETCEHLKSDLETKDIPIIFLTAKDETSDVVKGLAIGAVDYVTKPFKGTELLSRVKTHLELKFAREELKELNATKDKFLSIIAHDLKNPMQALLLFTDALKSRFDTLNTDKLKEYIDKCFDNTRFLAQLLENLLEWALAEEGIIKCHPAEIDITAIVKENIELFQANAGEKNITLTAQIDGDYAAFADENMSRTVIRNLISNAVKFTNPKGEVTVTVSSQQDVSAIEISDNGIGIAAEDIDTLFKIGEHKTSRGTAKEKGTGLGLVLCHEFISRNNGTIDVTSTPGKGSTFTVKLPAKENTHLPEE
ncbi:MAG: hybrid sensor histidine kinase/response regulator [bacterium]|nr:hybrid sensor histidine kinase/response regulator [bacterium]